MDNQDRPGYSREEHFYRPQSYGSGKLPGSNPPPFWRRHLLIIITSISVVLMLIFALITFAVLTGQRGSGPVGSSAATATPNPAPTSGTTSVINSTPTSQPGPIGLPCVVDISKWTHGTADWKVLSNMLLNDGTNGNWDGSGPTIVAPCQLGNTANYAVETQIQVLSHSGAPCFGITVRGSSAGRYMAGVGKGMYSFSEDWTRAYLTGPGYSGDSVSPSVSFDPSTSMHTYRVEANGNVINFLIDGSSIESITDNRYLTGTQVGLWSKNVQLQVTSFQVMALS